MGQITIYSSGLCSCSVCAEKSKDIKSITKELNAINPTGISSKWQLSKSNFQTGETNPCECNSDSERLHYLFEC